MADNPKNPAAALVAATLIATIKDAFEKAEHEFIDLDYKLEREIALLNERKDASGLTPTEQRKLVLLYRRRMIIQQAADDEAWPTVELLESSGAAAALKSQFDELRKPLDEALKDLKNFATFFKTVSQI